MKDVVHIEAKRRWFGPSVTYCGVVYPTGKYKVYRVRGANCRACKAAVAAEKAAKKAGKR
jgi:hypothetical protein